VHRNRREQLKILRSSNYQFFKNHCESLNIVCPPTLAECLAIQQIEEKGGEGTVTNTRERQIVEREQSDEEYSNYDSETVQRETAAVTPTRTTMSSLFKPKMLLAPSPDNPNISKFWALMIDHDIDDV
jgi:hypothetical protein